MVDTSAAAAIFLGEDRHEELVDIIDDADRAYMSAVSRVELMSVLCGRRIGARPDQASAFIDSLNLEHMAVTVGQASRAIDALLQFGKGRHAAGLNLGNCFPYALAKELGADLLFTGSDFAQTDIRPAWRAGP